MTWLKPAPKILTVASKEGLLRMKDPNRRYALAMPDIPQYRTQCENLASWVRQRMKLYLIFVNADASVQIIVPCA